MSENLVIRCRQCGEYFDSVGPDLGGLCERCRKPAEPKTPEIPVEREDGSFPAPFGHKIYPWGKEGFVAYVRVFRPYSKALLAGEPNAPRYGPPQIEYTGGGNGFSVAEAERLMAAFQIAIGIVGRIAEMNAPSELD